MVIVGARQVPETGYEWNSSEAICQWVDQLLRKLSLKLLT